MPGAGRPAEPKILICPLMRDVVRFVAGRRGRFRQTRGVCPSEVTMSLSQRGVGDRDVCFHVRSFASAAFAGAPTRSGRSRPGIRGARMNGLFERSEMSHVGLACSTGRADGHRQPQTHAMQPPHAGSHTRPPAVLVTGDSDSLLVADKAPDEGGAPRGTFEDGARPGPRIITWSISSRRTGH